MKLLKHDNNFYILTKQICRKNTLEDIWLTDFGDYVYIMDNHFSSFDGIVFVECDFIEIEDWIAKLFFTVKGK